MDGVRLLESHVKKLSPSPPHMHTRWQFLCESHEAKSMEPRSCHCLATLHGWRYDFGSFWGAQSIVAQRPRLRKRKELFYAGNVGATYPQLGPALHWPHSLWMAVASQHPHKKLLRLPDSSWQACRSKVQSLPKVEFGSFFSQPSSHASMSDETGTEIIAACELGQATRRLGVDSGFIFRAHWPCQDSYEPSVWNGATTVAQQGKYLSRTEDPRYLVQALQGEWSWEERNRAMNKDLAAHVATGNLLLPKHMYSQL